MFSENLFFRDHSLGLEKEYTFLIVSSFPGGETRIYILGINYVSFHFPTPFFIADFLDKSNFPLRPNSTTYNPYIVMTVHNVLHFMNYTVSQKLTKQNPICLLLQTK